MKYERASLEVDVDKYEAGKGLEDGFQLWSNVVTNGWITTESLVKIKRDDGSIVCPFIQNKRGLVFIREGDYIIKEGDNERHVCGAEKFEKRFKKIEE